MDNWKKLWSFLAVCFLRIAFWHTGHEVHTQIISHRWTTSQSAHITWQHATNALVLTHLVVRALRYPEVLKSGSTQRCRILTPRVYSEGLHSFTTISTGYPHTREYPDFRIAGCMQAWMKVTSLNCFLCQRVHWCIHWHGRMHITCNVLCSDKTALRTLHMVTWSNHQASGRLPTRGPVVHGAMTHGPSGWNMQKMNVACRCPALWTYECPIARCRNVCIPNDSNTASAKQARYCWVSPSTLFL